MWFFRREGRATYLEFLRNLTPQILLFAVIVLIGEKLSSRPLESGLWNTVAIVILISFAIMWVLAFAANGSLLYDKAIDSCPDIAQHKSKLKNEGIKGARLAWKSFKFTFDNHPLLILEVVIIIFVIYAATILAMVSGVMTALGFLKNAG